MNNASIAAVADTIHPALGIPLSRPVERRSTSTAASGQRLEAFDTARGTAMLLVCLSHFTAVYFRSEYQNAGNLLPVQIAMLASPTFMAVSGMMVGLMSVVYSRGFDKLRIKLLDRALFLLTAGHFLVVLARLQQDGVLALRSTVITDAVGVSLIIGLWLVPLTRARTRVLLGLTVFAIAWLLEYKWHPVAHGLLAVKEVLVGGLPNHVMWYTVPLLQWLAVYLMCTALGQRLGAYYLQNDRRAVERAFAVVAVSSILLGVALRVASWAFRPPVNPGAPVWLYEPFFSPWSKESPSPVYVLFFGGMGMALVWLVMVVSHRGWAGNALQGVTRIGRSSLAVFVLQQYVYYGLVGLVAPVLPHSAAWPLFFALSLVPIFLFARVWDSRQLNRVLTVGVKKPLERRFLQRTARGDTA
jgi:uncharacterized membrane protein